MESRTFEINIISAKDLNDVNTFSKMDVYVLVSIGGDRRTQKKTPVDHDGGKNPSWNCPMKFTIDELAARQNRLNLIFQLKAERTLGDRDIGEVQVPIKELLDSVGDGKSNQFVSYQVRKPNGKAKGELNFSYKFGEKVSSVNAYPPPAAKMQEPVTAYPPSVPAYPPPGSKMEEPVTAYPAPAGTSSPYPAYPPPGAAGAYPPPPHGGPYPPAPAGYPPPQPAAGYGYPPQGQGYGYPPQQGYGYPPQQQQKPQKKNKFGMGLGAGLLGGALGGLLIGDMVSDHGGYDGGYDGGFDGGFDF